VAGLAVSASLRPESINLRLAASSCSWEVVLGPAISALIGTASSSGLRRPYTHPPSKPSAPARSLPKLLTAPPPPLSRWSASPAKRLFDLACVLCSLPLAFPVLLLAALAVRLTSRGPVLFRQQRIGRNGRPFTIYKFRTMPVHPQPDLRPPITTAANQRFTPVGPFLRRSKLDELPQLFNVLRGDMSLVGPRPKLPWLHSGNLACRPGITGRATRIFAREEIALSTIPNAHLDAYYRRVIRPLKQRFDDDYMAKATFASDLSLLLCSVLRLWGEDRVSSILPLPGANEPIPG